MQDTATQTSVTIKRVGDQPSTKGPAEYFTGAVRVDPLISPLEPSRLAGALVTFEPGARTAWHTHPAGQTLIVTAGMGWVKEEGRARQEIRPGDVVVIPANVKHWHGATSTTGMSHIALQETVDGTPVTWMEHVTDDDYLAS
jgi:quercetin dioxygenase-like cupin family protein